MASNVFLYCAGVNRIQCKGFLLECSFCLISCSSHCFQWCSCKWTFPRAAFASGGASSFARARTYKTVVERSCTSMDCYCWILAVSTEIQKQLQPLCPVWPLNMKVAFQKVIPTSRFNSSSTDKYMMKSFRSDCFLLSSRCTSFWTSLWQVILLVDYYSICLVKEICESMTSIFLTPYYMKIKR